MKRFFKRHIYLGRMVDRTDDEFIGNLNEHMEVRPNALRWFCGMNDLQMSYTCQAL